MYYYLLTVHHVSIMGVVVMVVMHRWRQCCAAAWRRCYWLLHRRPGRYGLAHVGGCGLMAEMADNGGLDGAVVVLVVIGAEPVSDVTRSFGH